MRGNVSAFVRVSRAGHLISYLEIASWYCTGPDHELGHVVTFFHTCSLQRLTPSTRSSVKVALDFSDPAVTQFVFLDKGSEGFFRIVISGSS